MSCAKYIVERLCNSLIICLIFHSRVYIQDWRQTRTMLATISFEIMRLARKVTTIKLRVHAEILQLTINLITKKSFILDL